MAPFVSQEWALDLCFSLEFWASWRTSSSYLRFCESKTQLIIFGLELTSLYNIYSYSVESSSFWSWIPKALEWSLISLSFPLRLTSSQELLRLGFRCPFWLLVFWWTDFITWYLDFFLLLSSVFSPHLSVHLLFCTTPLPSAQNLTVTPNDLRKPDILAKWSQPCFIVAMSYMLKICLLPSQELPVFSYPAPTWNNLEFLQDWEARLLHKASPVDANSFQLALHADSIYNR